MKALYAVHLRHVVDAMDLAESSTGADVTFDGRAIHLDGAEWLAHDGCRHVVCYGSDGDACRRGEEFDIRMLCDVEFGVFVASDEEVSRG